MLQASRLPYEVPVFQAMFGIRSVLCQLTGKSGRFTLDSVSLIMNAAALLNTENECTDFASVVNTGFEYSPPLLIAE